MSEQRATMWLRKMLDEGARISWSIPHARVRAAERDVSLLEAERIVRSGLVTEIRIEDGQERWCVSGTDTDERPIDVVVLPIRAEIIRIMTVIRKDQ